MAYAPPTLTSRALMWIARHLGLRTPLEEIEKTVENVKV